MTDFVTESQFNERLNRINDRVHAVDEASRARDAALGERVARVEALVPELRSTLSALRADILERIDASETHRHEELAALRADLATYEAAVRRWMTVERAARAGVGLLGSLPLLAWLKRLLGWTTLLAAGAALGGLIFLMVLAS